MVSDVSVSSGVGIGCTAEVDGHHVVGDGIAIGFVWLLVLNVVVVIHNHFHLFVFCGIGDDDGDVCDDDIDGDGVNNGDDAFPNDGNETVDFLVGEDFLPRLPGVTDFFWRGLSFLLASSRSVEIGCFLCLRKTIKAAKIATIRHADPQITYLAAKGVSKARGHDGQSRRDGFKAREWERLSHHRPDSTQH